MAEGIIAHFVIHELYTSQLSDIHIELDTPVSVCRHHWEQKTTTHVQIFIGEPVWDHWTCDPEPKIKLDSTVRLQYFDKTDFQNRRNRCWATFNHLKSQVTRK